MNAFLKNSLTALGVMTLTVVAVPSVLADEFDAQAAIANYDCIGNVCVGMSVRVNYGHWAGHAGAVVGIDHYNQTVTVVNSSGVYLYPLAREVSPMQSGNPSYCDGGICVGDRVQVLDGGSRGLIGQVVGTSSWDYTATVLLPSGRYLTTSLRNLHVLARNTNPYPRPGYPAPYPPTNPRVCPPGQVYDRYRGCVRVGQPIPIPPRRVEPPRRSPIPNCPRGTVYRNGACRRY